MVISLFVEVEKEREREVTRHPMASSSGNDGVAAAAALAATAVHAEGIVTDDTHHIERFDRCSPGNASTLPLERCCLESEEGAAGQPPVASAAPDGADHRSSNSGSSDGDHAGGSALRASLEAPSSDTEDNTTIAGVAEGTEAAGASPDSANAADADGKAGDCHATKEDERAPPAPPRRPSTAYFLFANANRSRVKEEVPSALIDRACRASLDASVYLYLSCTH